MLLVSSLGSSNRSRTNSIIQSLRIPWTALSGLRWVPDSMLCHRMLLRRAIRPRHVLKIVGITPGNNRRGGVCVFWRCAASCLLGPFSLKIVSCQPLLLFLGADSNKLDADHLKMNAQTLGNRQNNFLLTRGKEHHDYYLEVSYAAWCPQLILWVSDAERRRCGGLKSASVPWLLIQLNN